MYASGSLPRRTGDSEPLIYLDNGATSFPKPEEVYRLHGRLLPALRGEPGPVRLRPLHRVRRPGRGRRGACCAPSSAARDPNRLVFGYNATDALNLAIFGLLQPGDHAVTTHLEHNSSLRPLWHLQQQGVEVDWVDFDEHGLHRSGRGHRAAAAATPAPS